MRAAKWALALMLLCAAPAVAQWQPIFWVPLSGGQPNSAGTGVSSVGIQAPSEFVTTCGTNPVISFGTLCLDWADATRGHGTMSKAITISSPGAAENRTVFFTPVAITLTQVRGVVVGSSPSVTYNVKYGTDRSAAGTSVVTAPAATTNTTTGVNATIANSAVSANSYIWVTTSAQSGTVSDMNVTIVYTQP